MPVFSDSEKIHFYVGRKNRRAIRDICQIHSSYICSISGTWIRTIEIIKIIGPPACDELFSRGLNLVQEFDVAIEFDDFDGQLFFPNIAGIGHQHCRRAVFREKCLVSVEQSRDQRRISLHVRVSIEQRRQKATAELNSSGYLNANFRLPMPPMDPP